MQWLVCQCSHNILLLGLYIYIYIAKTIQFIDTGSKPTLSIVVLFHDSRSASEAFIERKEGAIRGD